MKIATLIVGLFPDADTMQRGIDCLPAACRVSRLDATRGDLEDEDWDGMLEEILAADRVIVV